VLAERLARLGEEEKWTPAKSVYGLPKVANRKQALAKAEKAVAIKDKKPIKTIASNAGHCLWSGIASPEGYSEGASPSYVSDFLATSEGLALTRAFTRITDTKLRRSIVELVEQIASREAPDKR